MEKMAKTDVCLREMVQITFLIIKTSILILLLFLIDGETETCRLGCGFQLSASSVKGQFTQINKKI